MSKKLIDGTEYFDGQPVTIYEGRMAGSFEMEEDIAAPLCHDEQLTFIVTCRVEAPKFTYLKKTGDLKRANTFRAEHVALLDGHEARYLLDNMGEAVEGVNDGLIESDDNVATHPEGSYITNVDKETGEIGSTDLSFTFGEVL